MVFASGFALCAAITGAAALQIPLLHTLLDHPSGSKPMVNSTELQDLITEDRLMIRANKLYEIAKLGEDEFNHPTRVIGSAGTEAYVLIMLED
jgi:aminopeptidase Y